MEIWGNHKHQRDALETSTQRHHKHQCRPMMEPRLSLLSYAKPRAHLASSAIHCWSQRPDQPFAYRSNIERNGSITVSSQCPCGWMSGQSDCLQRADSRAICGHKKVSFFIDEKCCWNKFSLTARLAHHLSLVWDRTIMTRWSHLFGHLCPIKPLDKDFSVRKAVRIELFMEHSRLLLFFHFFSLFFIFYVILWKSVFIINHALNSSKQTRRTANESNS